MAAYSLAGQGFKSLGSYAAYASNFYKQAHPSTTPATDTIAGDTTGFTASAANPCAISSNYPATVCPSGVYSYNFLAFGNYDYTNPAAPVTPKQVGAISSCKQTYGWSHTSGSGHYNLLAEFYLTSVAGDSSTKQIEIGFFLHTSAEALAYATAGTSLGIFTEPGGRQWDAWKQVGGSGTYIMFLPHGGGDKLAGTVDYLSALLWLNGLSPSLVNTAWYFNGCAMGVETICGDVAVSVTAMTVAFT